MAAQGFPQHSRRIRVGAGPPSVDEGVWVRARGQEDGDPPLTALMLERMGGGVPVVETPHDREGPLSRAGVSKRHRMQV